MSSSRQQEKGLWFEQRVQSFFEERDFPVFDTPETNDFGADLILHYNGKSIAIQCKDRLSPIGVSAVQEIVGAVSFYHSDVGMVISTGGFTPSARKLAAACGILLVDAKGFSRMIADNTGEIKYLEKLLAAAKPIRQPREQTPAPSLWDRIMARLCE